MICKTCIELFESDIKDRYTDGPWSVVSAAFTHPGNALSFLVSLNRKDTGKNKLEYETIRDAINYCIHCGEKLKEECK